MIARGTIKRVLKALRPCRRAIDRLSRLLPGSEAQAGTAAAAVEGPIRLGLWLTLIVFGVFGLWSGIAPLDSAALAPGQVVLDSNKKAIQHLEGGIVDEILVREGQRVAANQPLIRLRGTASKSKLASLQIQYFTAKAAQARLKAEQDGRATFDPPASLADGAGDDEMKRDVLDNQRKLFASRREAYESQAEGLRKKIEGYRRDIEGFSTQADAEGKEIALLEEEIASTRRLFAMGYASKPRLLALEREAEDLRGQRGQHAASIAHTEQSIAEARAQITSLEEDRLARTAGELKDVQATLTDVGEQLRASTDVVERVTVTSPIEGYVTGLGVHTVGGVVTPGEKLMDVVPANDKLIVEAQVSPQDIDAVRPGLTAFIRLGAYRSRWVPAIEGRVVTVSADRMTDSRTQAAYFLARIEVDPDYLRHLRGVSLYPGMPADTLIVTGERTLLGYLFMPIVEATRRAFRED